MSSSTPTATAWPPIQNQYPSSDGNTDSDSQAAFSMCSYELEYADGHSVAAQQRSTSNSTADDGGDDELRLRVESEFLSCFIMSYIYIYICIYIYIHTHNDNHDHNKGLQPGGGRAGPGGQRPARGGGHTNVDGTMAS